MRNIQVLLDNDNVLLYNMYRKVIVCGLNILYYSQLQ
jgi:hypothetical protein